MKNHYTYFILLLVLFQFTSFIHSEFVSGKYLCVGVADGDTIWLMISGNRTRVDLDGIDCPELGQEFGQNAKRFTTERAAGKQLEVNFHGYNEHKAPMARILSEKSDISLALLDAGLAWKTDSADLTYARSEKSAKDKKNGLWSLSNPVPPWEFRKDAIRLMNEKLPGNPKSLLIKPNADMKNVSPEKASTNIVEENESKTPDRRKALNEFENEIEGLVKAEIKDLESRWDQFVNACLINSDSKKYLFGRKWFQFYEDLNDEAPDISLVYKLKYFENPTCISYETEISNLIKTIKSNLFNAEKKATSNGVFLTDIISIENRYFIERREWKDIEIRPILKQRDLRDNH